MLQKILLFSFIFFFGFLEAKKVDTDRPNIIFIFADDMGIGDVSHNGGKAPTPHIDRMAKEGMCFTDAHTSSSVCTPSRYSLLTGRYCWRTHLEKGVYNTPTHPPLIKKDETTVASLLKQKGYHTACIGKWHLGIGWQTIPDFKAKEGQTGMGWNIDYTKPAVTPTSNGFDYFFGITASLDMPPYVYIENEHAVAIPTITRGGVKRGGPMTEDFKPTNCLRDFAAKTVNYIGQQAKEENPFFIYLPLTSPHSPVAPSENWLGTSGINKYCDYIMETDWVVGEVLKALDQNKISENTLVLFSTDNGCTPHRFDDAMRKAKHFPNGNLRGGKGDLFDGGHRVPLVVRWPAVVPASSKTDRLTCLTDFISTCSEIVEQDLDQASGVDGVSFLSTLKNPKVISNRKAIVHHSFHGNFSIREGNWKLNLHAGSGGFTKLNDREKALEKEGKLPDVQLYDLSKDIGELKNVQAQHPQKVQELTQLLQSYVEKGRSNQGEPQQNDRQVNIFDVQ